MTTQTRELMQEMAPQAAPAPRHNHDTLILLGLLLLIFLPTLLAFGIRLLAN